MKYIGECLVCGIICDTQSIKEPNFDNCPKCNSLISIGFITKTEYDIKKISQRTLDLSGLRDGIYEN